MKIKVLLMAGMLGLVSGAPAVWAAGSGNSTGSADFGTNVDNISFSVAGNQVSERFSGRVGIELRKIIAAATGGTGSFATAKDAIAALEAALIDNGGAMAGPLSQALRELIAKLPS